jgi:hypothetical protein
MAMTIELSSMWALKHLAIAIEYPIEYHEKPLRRRF